MYLPAAELDNMCKSPTRCLWATERLQGWRGPGEHLTGGIGRGHWPSCSLSGSEISSTVEMLGLRKDHPEQQQMWSRSSTAPVQQAACVMAGRAKRRGHPARWNPSDHG